MDKLITAAFLDEFMKIAESPAIQANNYFGLPIFPPRRGARRYDEGSDAVQGGQSGSQLLGNVMPATPIQDVANRATGVGGV